MISIIMPGVGGQGAVMLSNIIGLACARQQLPAKTGELHGLSQRSGSIVTHLRIGEDVLSPIIPIGGADAIAAMELMEALRYIEFLKPGGLVVSSRRIMHPSSETIAVSRKERTYVHEDEAVAGLQTIAGQLIFFDGPGLAVQAGDVRTENIVLLGALWGTGILPLPEQAIKEALIEQTPAKAQDANLAAFESGKMSLTRQ
jgi:indolepyruvate ferredoxin oxidoreductase, beta subunit